MAKTFKIWLEQKDLFGFKKEPKETQPDNMEEVPVFQTLKTNYIISLIKTHFKNSDTDEATYIQTGDYRGAIKLEITPNMNIEIMKKTHNSDGEDCWINKAVFGLDRNTSAGKEEKIAETLIDKILEYKDKEIEGPDDKFKNMEQLALTVASKTKSTQNKSLYFHSVRQVNENHFILRNYVSAAGVGYFGGQAYENQTHMILEKGMIKVFNQFIQRNKKTSSWEIKETTFDMLFSPKQSANEIAECIASFTKWIQF